MTHTCVGLHNIPVLSKVIIPSARIVIYSASYYYTATAAFCALLVYVFSCIHKVFLNTWTSTKIKKHKLTKPTSRRAPEATC